MSDEFKGKQAAAEEDHFSEVNEPISSTSDLEQEKKRVAHEFYAQGNTATTQIFIGQLGSMNLDPRRTRSAPSGPTTGRIYPVHTREGCREFVEQYKNSEYLAVAIVLSVFELVYLSDLHELNELLMEELPDAGPPEEDAPPAWDPYIERRFGPALSWAVGFHLNRLTKNDSAFLAILMFQSEYFRSLLTRLLGRMVRKAGNRGDRLTAAQTYLYLLRSCYYLVDAQDMELPLVACDTKKQQQDLAPVLAEVMGQVNLRNQLYAILRAYLKELDRYQYSEGLFNHLCAYFYNLTRPAPVYWRDILEFLSGFRGKLGRRLCEHMAVLYRSSRQLPSPTA